MINYARSKYHSIVEDIPAFVCDFSTKYSGYKRSLGEDNILAEAELLQKWGWK